MSSKVPMQEGWAENLEYDVFNAKMMKIAC